jgi:nitrogen fixation NifU-like protein
MKEAVDITTRSEPSDHDHDADEHLGHNLDPKFFAHAQMPQNLGEMPAADGRAVGIGTCGDSLEVFLAVMDGAIRQISHRPNGCVYTVACGSAMTRLVLGRSLEEALALTPEAVAEELGGLPEDHRHCAALAVNTLGEAIDDYYQKLWGGLAGHPPRRQPK